MSCGPQQPGGDTEETCEDALPLIDRVPQRQQYQLRRDRTMNPSRCLGFTRMAMKQTEGSLSQLS
jgi:hypothetical protein